MDNIEEMDEDLFTEKEIEKLDKKIPKNIKDKNKSFVTDSKNDKQLDEYLNDAFNDFLKSSADVSFDDSIREPIPSGIKLLDAVLGGGFLNKFSMLIGMPGCGKSALAARILSQGQKKYGKNFISMYIDSEQTQTKERLAKLGITKPMIEPIHDDITLERVFKIIEILKKFKEKNPETIETPSLVIWDSVVSTPSDASLEEDNPNSVTGLRARILSHSLPKCVSYLSKYNISLVAVNQFRDNIQMGIVKKAPDLKWIGQDNVVPGGKALIFNAAQLLVLKASSDLRSGDNDMVYGYRGNLVDLHAVKNKNFLPNIKIKMALSHEFGFSDFWTNFELLKDYKRIDGAAWKTLINNDTKFRQIDAIKLYKDNDQFRKDFDELVSEVIQKEYIERYSNNVNENQDIF